MTRIAKKYWIFLAFVFISLWASLASSSLNEQFRFSSGMNQIFSFLLYVPFAVAILWKVITDLTCFKVRLLNILFYVFAFYYLILTTYRFVTGAEVKEGLYYAVVIFGVFSLFALVTDKKIPWNSENVQDNFLAILGYLILYKLLVTFMEGSVFGDPPINNLYSTSVLVLFLPFMVHTLGKQNTARTRWNYVFLCLSIVLILVCRSRAIVMLAGIVFAVLFFTSIRSAAVIKRLLCVLFAAILIVGLLAGLDVGRVRFSLSREFNIVFHSDNPEVLLDPEDPFVQEQLDANAQIDRSDAMRSTLMEHGLAEVQKNPVFGTGDLYYTYDLGYKTMEQTAHNFLIESMVCYGLIGTGLIAAMLLCLFVEIGFFRKATVKHWRPWLFILISMFYYFALGMVQPSVYNTLVCPTFILVILYYGKLLTPSATNKTPKSFSLLKLRKDPTHGSEE